MMPPCLLNVPVEKCVRKVGCDIRRVSAEEVKVYALLYLDKATML